MNGSEPNESSQPNSERSEANIEGDKHGNNAALAANEVQIADILKLDIDCFEEVFEYLPFGDLISVSKTCKRLEQVAGYFFQQNFSDSIFCRDKGIWCWGEKNVHDVTHFGRFIYKILLVFNDSMEWLFRTRSKFQRLKQMHVHKLHLMNIVQLKEVSMGKLERLRMSFCIFGGNLKELIDHCPNLKRLEVIESYGKYNWLDRKYAKLEHFSIVPCEINVIEGLVEGVTRFLEINPNIRIFGVCALLLWRMKNEIIAANIKLDVLAIRMDNFCVRESFFEFDLFFNLLNNLHERGFYRKLNLYLDSICSQEQINQLATLNGLTKLHIAKYKKPYAFSSLNKIDELHVEKSDCIADLEILPNNLINLKRITFNRAGIDDIMPFIRRSVELQTITVRSLLKGRYFKKASIDNSVIDLLALNRERQKLPDAQKITLNCFECVYAPTKRAMRGTDFELIRLKRQYFIRWNDDT